MLGCLFIGLIWPKMAAKMKRLDPAELRMRLLSVALRTALSCGPMSPETRALWVKLQTFQCCRSIYTTTSCGWACTGGPQMKITISGFIALLQICKRTQTDFAGIGSCDEGY